LPVGLSDHDAALIPSRVESQEKRFGRSGRDEYEDQAASDVICRTDFAAVAYTNAEDLIPPYISPGLKSSLLDA
jgi:hypothetical protein